MRYKRTNLRWVALYEAVKGILVLGAASAAFKLVHMDVQKAAERLVSHFHLNPASRYPRIFLEIASNLSNIHLLALGLGALCLRCNSAGGSLRAVAWQAMGLDIRDGKRGPLSANRNI